MNCPYCNKLCERLRKYDWVCDNCPVTAVFSNWNEYDSPMNTGLSNFLEVGFLLKSNLWINFRPNTQEIELCYKNSIIIQTNSIVTSNNVQEIHDRIVNMKAFL